MATNSVSFNNTPQAKDDTYVWGEDALLQAGIYQSSTGTLLLDVMANDAGGNAKKLYSIDDGNGGSSNPTDLLGADAQVSGISAWELTASGNRARINNGKIELDVVGGINSLRADEVLADSFVYAIRLGNGTLSWARVNINITGANDAATITGQATATVFEDGATPISGKLTVNDVDHGENALQVVAAGTSGDNGFGTFTVLADGNWSYSLNNANPGVQALAQGETVTDSITVTSVDGTATQVITVTILGTNDAPAVAAALSAATSEGASAFALDLLEGASDVDNGETATLTVANLTYAVDGGVASTTIPAGLAFVGSSLSVNPSDPVFNSLAVGQTKTFTVSYDVTDVHGATVAQTETITITGTNDAPTVAAALTRTAAEGSASFSLNLLSGASDVDTGETATLSVTNLTYSINGGAASATLPAGLTLSGSSLTVNPNHAAFDSLNNGDVRTITVNYSVTDAQGATVPQTQTINITGVTDVVATAAPIVKFSLFQYWTDDTANLSVPLRYVSIEDADSVNTTASVTFRILDSTPNYLSAVSGNGVTVTGSGTQIIKLEGTFAALNAFINDNNVFWNKATPSSSFTQTLALIVDDNGSLPGGNVYNSTFAFLVRSDLQQTAGFTNLNGSLSLATNVLISADTDVNMAAGTDTVTTSYLHLPLNAVEPAVYNGGADYDTVRILMTPDQLADVLANTDNQNDLRDYFDGNPTGDTLQLSDSLWNADVTGFESAYLYLTNGNTGTYSDFTGYLTNLPVADSTPDADTEGDLVVGTAGDDFVFGGVGAGGSNGNDILVGLDGNDTLSAGAGNDLLLGGNGNDVLAGGDDIDVLSGGKGADTFVLNGYAYYNDYYAGSADKILDYSFVEGDKLDLSNLLANADMDHIANYLSITAVGNSLIVAVDDNGTAGGTNFMQTGILYGYNTNSPDPVRVFFNGEDHTFTV